MKILLIIPKYDVVRKGVSNNINYDYYFPIGLGYISSVIKKAGYNLDCVNLNHLNGKISDLVLDILNRKKYDIVCTGTNTMGYPIIKTIINSIRKHSSNPKIIIGGHIITTEPELIFNDLKPDFGVIGEGEETIIELLKTIENNADFSKVNGIIFFNGQNIVMTNSRLPINNIEDLPYPDFDNFEFEKLLDNADPFVNYIFNAFDNPRIYPIMGSRSCPYQCTFCYHDTKYRARSIDNIMQELKIAVRKYNINYIALYDDCFASTKERLFEFCEKIKKLRQDISRDLKWTCQLTVNSADKDVLDVMRESGCDVISYGFESYSSVVLKSMKKPITPEKIDMAVSNTIATRIGIQGFFIFGDTAETKETALETLHYWKTKAKGQIGIGFIQPYPGSQIYKRCVEKGIIKDKLDFIKNKMQSPMVFNMTNSMSDKEINWLKNETLKLTSKYISFVLPISTMVLGNSRYALKVKCPFCNEVIEYKNGIVRNIHMFSLFLLCRNCKMRFFVASRLAYFGYKIYPVARRARDLQNKIRNKTLELLNL